MQSVIHIVLVHPEIAPNTGNIARLCYGNNLRLHLIEPLGFHLDDTRMRRAGLDFWDKLDVSVHRDWETFVRAHPLAEQGHGRYFTARDGKSYWSLTYPDPVYLVFGAETSGFAASFKEAHRADLASIPMREPTGRSLNLSNAVAVAAYEAMRSIFTRSL
jgi:tRNA (cytidine/uridine-2'-O-)-methyltransferase